MDFGYCDTRAGEAGEDYKNSYGEGQIYYAKGGVDMDITPEELVAAIAEVAEKLGNKEKVCIVPPDFTRAHSQSGKVTKALYDHYGDKVKDIIPALGSHVPVTISEKDEMFAGVPHELFRVHNWRTDVAKVGEVSAKFINELCDKVNAPYPVQVNKPILLDGGHDVIFSVGQVVPHEVAGMANHTKNILVGTGGKEAIDQSHFLGAVYGMEKIMGRGANPVRQVYDEAFRTTKLGEMPFVWIQTVVSPRGPGQGLAIRGLYIGDGTLAFTKACELSVQVNLVMLEKRIQKCVVYLDPKEFKTTWLGNKSVYRTRLAMADRGELIVLAPGVHKFGEDEGIDELIRMYGYRTTPEILSYLEASTNPHGKEAAETLFDNKSCIAHLIHGSSEGRFTIRYCVDTENGLTQKEVEEEAGFSFGHYKEYQEKYLPAGVDAKHLKDGWETIKHEDGTEEEIFFVSNPAIGLWAYGPDFD